MKNKLFMIVLFFAFIFAEEKKQSLPLQNSLKNNPQDLSKKSNSSKDNKEYFIKKILNYITHLSDKERLIWFSILLGSFVTIKYLFSDDYSRYIEFIKEFTHACGYTEAKFNKKNQEFELGRYSPNMSASTEIKNIFKKYGLDDHQELYDVLEKNIKTTDENIIERIKILIKKIDKNDNNNYNLENIYNCFDFIEKKKNGNAYLKGFSLDTIENFIEDNILKYINQEELKHYFNANKKLIEEYKESVLKGFMTTFNHEGTLQIIKKDFKNIGEIIEGIFGTPLNIIKSQKKETASSEKEEA